MVSMWSSTLQHGIGLGMTSLPWLPSFTRQVSCHHILVTQIFAFIPKKLVPQVPTDYRPISLCNVVYKIIAKSLANRLKPHLPDYIDPSHKLLLKGVELVIT